MGLKRALVVPLLAAVLAAPAGANVQVGSSGWEWGNPLPQGNTLRAMSFAGATGYAAGDFGTLLKTTDGGTTWSGLPVGTFQGLSIVQAVDAETVVAGGGCVARRSTDGGRTFSAIAFTAIESSCRAPLRDLSFPSSERGFLLLEDGSVFTTSDGGTQFATRTAVPGTAAAGGGTQASAIAFVDATRGFAAATGRIFQTLDGGVSWKLVAEDGRGVNQLYFVDADHGFAVGSGGLFLRTVDGGQTWTPHALTNPPIDFRSIRCATTQLCVLVNVNGGTLVRTTNAGETLGTVITPSTDPVFAAAFASPTVVSAAGANGTTVRSADGGATFAPIGGRLPGSYAAIRAGGVPRAAFAAGRAGALAKTLDGGASWTRGDVPTTADLSDVSFPTVEIGYALDLDGGVFRTANGGETWKTLGTGSTRRPAAVYAPSAEVALVVGLRGIRRSVDGGETFAQVRAPAVLRAELFGAAPAGPRAIFAWGRSRLVRSTDAGRTWRALPRPSGAGAIAQASFSSARAGLLRDTRGRVWRTADAGRRWTLLRGVGTERVVGMAAASARAAYLVIDRFGGRGGGYLLRTDDAGATWQPQLVVEAPIRASGIAAADDGTDYLLAGEAALLASRTGGSAGEPSTLTLATKRRRVPTPRAITVTGRLRPASGGAQVVVAALGPRGRRWQQQMVNVASNGTFATRWQVRRGTTAFVAQWAGDFASAGAGSRLMTVEVGARRRSRRG
jgi:photosystem II stability/assembly factor-like uncharacterized protein